ncbi:hypothetical protein L2719_17475 [Shewanella schlegeliana]|uniref:Bacteriocin n=1 Tax=Shewanella schlegeliana TaxID=190308 RepID=A0ABS1SU58_9GAMM|nr:hypothetical protein [Shewanella schlegeliana]MBL4912078.1 hypothetical protein [Shewanella schlegeliana]MCL1111324.1 hypothetical protein [Shewanella schlegeliana]GIU33019.1 hypothetical protein TUM4433_26780 [Shewanella schlegeliana]
MQVTIMEELTMDEMKVVNGGGADWGEVGAGIGFIGLSLAMVSGPIGWIGLGAATGFSYFGGTLVGSGISGNNVWSLR